ncbi:MAG: hypothetical protein IKS49_06825 [Actinomycetaceae bacterium]|nr:hypothetical protein [Actinomycetaceae bacterium]
MDTIDKRINKARGFATLTAARLRYGFPIQHEDGGYPLTITIPDEPLSQCIRRAKSLDDAVNLVVVTGEKIETCVLRISADAEADENTIVLPQNSSYTVGQYIQDSRDLGTFLPVHTMDGMTMITDSPLDTLTPA